MSSFDRPQHSESGVSAWIARFAPLIASGGTVLDLAAGHGRHTRFLLARGHRVTATDIDVSDLRDLEQHARCEIIEADLETGKWPFIGRAFGGIVVTNYLHRPHFSRLLAAVAPGGVLLIESFGAGNERYGRPRNPDFLLQPGELLQTFAGELQVVAYEHGLERAPRAAVRQRLCAVRDAVPRDLAASD